MKKDIVRGKSARVSSPTERPRLHLLLLYAFTIFGMTLFFAGFHNVDIAQHYYRSQTDGHFIEANFIGQTSSIDNVYVNGMVEMFLGFIIFAFGGNFYGSLMEILSRRGGAR